jgi:hypothetical protein
MGVTRTTLLSAIEFGSLRILILSSNDVHFALIPIVLAHEAEFTTYNCFGKSLIRTLVAVLFLR